MTLLSLILVLLLETFWSQLKHYRQHRLISLYAQRWRGFFDTQGTMDSWWVAFLILLPPVLIIWLLTEQHGVTGLMLELLLSVVLLSWSLGPLTLIQKFHQLSQNDYSESSSCRALLKYVHQSYFAIIFWFFIFGPAAAISYRILQHLAEVNEYENTVDPENTSSDLQETWCKLFAIVDWIPARLTGCLYLLTGDFIKGFKTFRQHLLLLEKDSDALVVDTGVDALALDEDDDALLAARSIAERSLILLLAMIAVISVFQIG